MTSLTTCKAWENMFSREASCLVDSLKTPLKQSIFTRLLTYESATHIRTKKKKKKKSNKALDILQHPTTIMFTF